jgi:hypothetical protein
LSGARRCNVELYDLLDTYKINNLIVKNQDIGKMVMGVERSKALF